MIEIELDERICSGCGLCVDLCPVSVFDMTEVNGRKLPRPTRAQDCWACETCVGQCPTGAIRIEETPAPIGEKVAGDLTPRGNASKKRVQNLSKEQKGQYASWSEALKRVLCLRWEPVAITLVPAGAALPLVSQPRVKMRFCQSLMA